MRTQRRSQRDSAELSPCTPSSSFWQDWCTQQAAAKAHVQHREDKNASDRDPGVFLREQTTETMRWSRRRLERGEAAGTASQETPPLWRGRAAFSHRRPTVTAPTRLCCEEELPALGRRGSGPWDQSVCPSARGKDMRKTDSSALTVPKPGPTFWVFFYYRLCLDG